MKKGTFEEERTNEVTDKYNTVFKRLQGDSQNTLILELLLRGEELTQRGVARDYNIYRLASRISDLRRYGVPIETVMADNLHNSGRHAVYTLGVGA